MAFVNKHKHTFELEQITPILHFQGREEGAAVRASEMKPKFDRFLLEYCKDAVEESWIRVTAGKDSDTDKDKLDALDYKLNIFVDKNTHPWKNMEKKLPGGYFGDLKGDYAVLSQGIKVVITCYIDSLMDVIKEVFPVFLAVTNFGSRQRMGYGSFCVKKTNRSNLIRTYAKKLGEGRVLAYTLNYPVNAGRITPEQMLEIIRDFHQHLKSGANLKIKDKTIFYDKSYLLKQYRGINMRDSINEKKAMKVVIAKAAAYGRPLYEIGNLCNSQANDIKDEQSLRAVDLKKTKVKYLRGLLGFAGNYSFRNVGTNLRNGTRYGEVTFQLDAGEKVKRFPSPVTYLPDARGIHILVNKAQIEEIMRINPTITASIGKVGVKNAQVDQLTMHLPEDFKVNDFFDSIIKTKIRSRVRDFSSKDKSKPIYYYELRKM